MAKLPSKLAIRLRSWLNWSHLLALRLSSPLSIATLFALALLADGLALFGKSLPLRTQLAVASSIAFAAYAALVTIAAPATVKATRALKESANQGGTSELWNLWKKDLRAHKDVIGERDLRNTLAHLRKLCGLGQLPDKANYSQLLTSLDDLTDLKMEDFAVHARETLEHVRKPVQLACAGILALAGLSMIVALTLCTISIFSAP